MKNNQQKLKKIVLIAILAAVSYLLMFVAFPVLPYLPFLKLDFAEIPILIGLFMIGFWGAIEISILTMFLYWLTFGFSIIEFVGLLGSFGASIVFILVFFIFKKYVLKFNLLSFIPIVIATIILIIVMSLLNYYALIPAYVKISDFKLGISLGKLILVGIIPFNLIKGIAVGTVFLIISKRLRGWYKFNEI